MLEKIQALLEKYEYINLIYLSFALLVVYKIINFILMRLSHKIKNTIGNSGAIVISKVMGLILASMAANNFLMGIKEFFKL
jgi:multiple antibiotic resistance protein